MANAAFFVTSVVTMSTTTAPSPSPPTTSRSCGCATPAAPASAGMRATAAIIGVCASSRSTPTRRASRRISGLSMGIRRVESMSRLSWTGGGSLLSEDWDAEWGGMSGSGW